jgi:putative DNA primase/helicase
MDGIEEFQGAMRANGLNPPEIIEPGKLHRFPTNGKRHDDAGWCKLFADGGGGVFGDFRSGLSESWQAQREAPFTPAERESFRRRCEAERRAREAEKVRRHADACDKAAAILEGATGDPPEHPYVKLV